jgi:hypothetical protein
MPIITLDSLVMPGRGYREAVLQAAAGQLDAKDHRVNDYWRDVLGVDWHGGVFPPQWCGAFDLWCLHQAGLGLHKHWKVGLGFLLTAPDCLPVIATPQPGDTSYKGTPFQHHAIVESVDAAGVVHTIDGNQGSPLYIKRSSHKLADKAFTYFSISPLIDRAEADRRAAP